LVSFSLTPMMCARLLRAEDAASGHAAEGEHTAASRGGFYAWLDRGYTWSLALSMRHRWAIVLVSALVLVSAVPIYRQVKQEYIPSDVDESEFEVLVFGPEHMSLAAMDEAMQALAREARETNGEALKLKARALGGIVDVDSTLRLDKPELRVAIDRQRAADLRVDTQQIASALRLMVGGDDQVSRFHDPTVNDDYDVQVRLLPQFRGNLSTISRLYVSRESTSTNPATGAPAQVNLAPGGGLVRLDNVVKIERAAIASRIDRTDRQRETRVRAMV